MAQFSWQEAQLCFILCHSGLTSEEGRKPASVSYSCWPGFCIGDLDAQSTHARAHAACVCVRTTFWMGLWRRYGATPTSSLAACPSQRCTPPRFRTAQLPSAVPACGGEGGRCAHKPQACGDERERGLIGGGMECLECRAAIIRGPRLLLVTRNLDLVWEPSQHRRLS